ncbi:hypothetical protein EYF80_050121 [Liparis tanakae]|uniref:Uncharacterized protein n=1 Tax=Liparis tanakae TaxID=230148 RepID=A0A4Z2FFP0_9TELE|nr:hypothetical protein EYF80_050121 [Liparis tanakae]
MAQQGLKKSTPACHPAAVSASPLGAHGHRSTVPQPFIFAVFIRTVMKTSSFLNLTSLGELHEGLRGDFLFLLSRSLPAAALIRISDRFALAFLRPPARLLFPVGRRVCGVW